MTDVRGEPHHSRKRRSETGREWAVAVGEICIDAGSRGETRGGVLPRWCDDGRQGYMLLTELEYGSKGVSSVKSLQGKKRGGGEGILSRFMLRRPSQTRNLLRAQFAASRFCQRDPRRSDEPVTGNDGFREYTELCGKVGPGETVQAAWI